MPWLRVKGLEIVSLEMISGYILLLIKLNHAREVNYMIETASN